ncbi:MAG TPA: TPM domain-containing protein [Bryobacteraceae bacterium]|nr:TPM domain-containing protein [Bryobacteraceae bacterium]
MAQAFLPVLLFASTVFALDLNKLTPQGYVSDFAHVLDNSSRLRLEAYCGRVEQVTGVQMAIVTIDTLDGEPIDDVTNTLYRKWGVGKKGKDEGIMLLLAIKDHRDRLEIGYGLEPLLPDGFDGSVLREARPLLRQNAYGPALFAAAQEMGSRIAAAKGVTLDVSLRPQRRVVGQRPGIPWPFIIIGIIVLLVLMRGGGGGGFLTGMILGNLLGRGGGGGGWGGGGFGGYDSGGGGGGGGFGGFGGGDSGGGGASSDW